MDAALAIGKTGLEAQQTRIQVITNNLANVSTTGFKRGRAEFEDLAYQTIVQPGSQSSGDTVLPSGLMLGTGVRTVATQKDFSSGDIKKTENSFDIAIQGRGFIQVTMPDGNVGYTRAGALQVDSTGQLVTSNGYKIQPSITIPANTLSVTIGSDGTISALVSGSTTASAVGNFQLADFINPAGLQPIGQNLYQETTSSGSAQVGAPGSNGIGRLLQGALENSNVNVVEELVNLIEAQRAYEMAGRGISVTDQMLEYASQRL